LDYSWDTSPNAGYTKIYFFTKTQASNKIQHCVYNNRTASLFGKHTYRFL